MVNCSYCKAQINRNVFCKPSHKVMFHRKKDEGGLLKRVKSKTEEEIEELTLRAIAPDALCKHGAAKNLCKHGC